jgi:hypothetical protein
MTLRVDCSIMIEQEQHETEPDEVPTDEQLDVEGPNESTHPSGAPVGNDDADDEDEAG